jgi:hypothetical protein
MSASRCSTSGGFYNRARVADPRLDALDLAGFLVEDLGAVRTFRATEGGVEYEVSEIRKALFAQRPGTITIPPSRLWCSWCSRRSAARIDPFGALAARSTSSSGACGPRP